MLKPPTVKATALLMALCLLLTALAGGGGDSLARLRWGALSPVLLEAGQWWRVYTSNLLHSDWWSLIFVLNTLGWLGWWLAPRYRAIGLLDLFSLAGVAGALAALKWPLGPSLGAVAPAFALLLAGLIALREQRATVVGLLLLNGAVAWKLHWNPASLAAGVVVGLLWEVGLRRLPKGALSVPMVIAWVWALTWFASYKDVSSYPTRLYKDPRFQLRHSVLLQPTKPSDDGRVFVFSGLGYEVGLAFLTEPFQASVREFGAAHGGAVPEGMKIARETEEVTPERVWLRLDLEPKVPGQGPSQGVMLITAQGRQRIHLGLLLGANRSVAQVLPLLTQIQRSLVLEVPAAQVKAQRAYEESIGERKAGKREEAVASLGRALKEDPAMLDALISRGYLLGELGRPAEAEADYAAAIKSAPLDPRAYLNRAMLRINGGDFAGARPDLDKALERAQEKSGTRFEALNARAWCKAHLGDPAGALKDADAALALNPPPDLKALALDTRGFALEGLKRYPEALNDYEEAQKEKVPDAYLHAGELLVKLGRKAEGRKALEEFLILAPSRPEAARVKTLLTSLER